MGALVDQAAAIAREAHAGQLRKGAGEVPYFTHVESVARRLVAAGVSDDETVAAAYLHDVFEDQPSFAARVRSEMPADVVAAVELLTEKKLDDAGKKRPKMDRFRDYSAGLAARTPAAARAASVSCADKIDNLESLLECEARGEQLLCKLATRPGEHEQQLAELREIYAGAVPAPLLAAFDAARARLLEYLGRWLPGRAIAIAASAHLGQFDKSGAPYILHPLRMMERGQSAAEKMAAVLHDVVEDTEWTLAELAREGFPREVLSAIECLSKREGEPYETFVERVLEDPIATRVKLFDLEDNLDVRRLVAVTAKDLERIEKYHRARARILAKLG